MLLQKSLQLFLLVLSVQVNGQPDLSLLTNEFASVESALNSKSNIASATYNPSSNAEGKGLQLLFAGERRFMLSELAYYNAIAAFNTKGTGVLIGLGYAGVPEFKTTAANIGMVKKLGEQIALSIRFEYNSSSSKGYRPNSTVSFSLGSMFRINEKFKIGIVAIRPKSISIGDEKTTVSQSEYGISFGYTASSKFYLGCSLGRKEEKNISILAGFRYQLVNRVLIRAGVSSVTSSPWIGVAIRFKDFTLCTNMSYHPVLGITPGLMLMMQNLTQDDE